MARSGRITLAEMSKGNEGLLRSANSDSVDTATSPTIRELAESLSFSPGDGRIWLNDQRMILMHTMSLGELRRDVIDAVGMQRAQEILVRNGFASGARDGEVVRKQWPDSDLASAFAAGPRLHALEGVAKVTPVRFEFDIGQGTFYGEFLWHDSVEAEQHIAAYGTGSRPACWMQVGHASGYASAFLGRLVTYREVECRAMGHSHCRILGRPAAEWGDDEEARFFRFDHAPFAPSERPEPARSRPWRGLESRLPADQRAMLGVSAAFIAARTTLEKVAGTNATVLLSGESGVGKELFADALHRLSVRHDKPFVAINCAAIPDTLVEAELFGVERGAFTGAVASRPGRFERASGGTLFLDEIASLSLVAQGKLLRAIQEGMIDRVGSTQPTKVDVRLVAATNIDLRREIEAKRFRQDLFYRLNVCLIEIPPLRERRSDIPVLVDHFIDFYSRLHGRRPSGLTRRAVDALLGYDYPGNIRELQNLIERSVILGSEGQPLDTIHMFGRDEAPLKQGFVLGREGTLVHSSLEDTASENAALHQDGVLDVLMQSGVTIPQLEYRLYDLAVTRENGNIAAAARRLGLTRAQLEYRLKKNSGSG